MKCLLLQTRVSGIMTNAPFLLNVDCDMYVNNPQVVLHAICMFLGVDNERDSAFVQFPPYFYDGIKDDPFGNQYDVLVKVSTICMTLKYVVLLSTDNSVLYMLV